MIDYEQEGSGRRAERKRLLATLLEREVGGSLTVCLLIRLCPHRGEPPCYGGFSPPPLDGTEGVLAFFVRLQAVKSVLSIRFSALRVQNYEYFSETTTDIPKKHCNFAAMEIKISSLNCINDAAKDFLTHFGLFPLPSSLLSSRVFAFYGKMGAGKTTFIKALCDVLQVDDVVNSPTFAIVNEYSSALLQGPVFHFDFYRIRRLEEAYDIGIDDYFYSGAPCLIEWPELIEELLPDDVVRIGIEELPDGTRRITWAD